MRCAVDGPGRLVCGAVAVTIWLAPTSVRAGGFEIPDLGTIPIGRGGAFTAKADSLAAYHYNPAGIAKLSGPNLLLVGNVVHLDSEFRRGGTGQEVLPPGNDPTITVNDPAFDPNTGDPFDAVRNGRRFGPAPMLVFSWGDVGIEGLALQLGVMPASGFGNHRWPDRGPQRYTIREGSFTFLSVGGGVSYQLNRYFSIGANFLSGMFLSEFNVATRRGLTGSMQNEGFDGDNDVNIEARDLFVPSANFGVLSQPLDWLELGLAVRLPFATEATGSLTYTPGKETPEAELASDSHVRIEQTFPTVVRAGARYIHDVFDVELDFVWEDYSTVDAIGVEFSNPNADFNPADVLPASPYDDPTLLYLDVFGNGTAFQPVIASDQPLHFRDTYSVRLGSDVEVWPEHLTLRGGALWQSSAYPEDNRTYTIRFPFTEQLGLGGGVTWHALPQLDVSAGYLHLFQPEVVVDEGIVQANAFRNPDDENKLGNIINNGRYRASIDIFGVALEGHFWAGRNKRNKT